ncbi:unnamed protein product [Calypogeia fissa]
MWKTRDHSTVELYLINPMFMKARDFRDIRWKLRALMGPPGLSGKGTPGDARGVKLIHRSLNALFSINYLRAPSASVVIDDTTGGCRVQTCLSDSSRKGSLQSSDPSLRTEHSSEYSKCNQLMSKNRDDCVPDSQFSRVSSASRSLLKPTSFWALSDLVAECRSQPFLDSLPLPLLLLRE